MRLPHAPGVGAGVRGDELRGAVNFGLVDRADGEAEGFETRLEQGGDGLDAGDVHGAGVDFDELAEEVDVSLRVAVDGRYDLCFDRVGGACANKGARNRRAAAAGRRR